MFPYIADLGFIKIPAYGFFMALGFIFGYLWIFKTAEETSLDKDIIENAVFYSVLFGLLGGKIVYVLTFWEYFGINFFERFKNVFSYENLTSGFVFYGGLLGAVLALSVYSKRKKVFFLTLADLLSPALALGHFFGRLGCFFAGCCHGSPTDSIFSVKFTDKFCQVNPGLLGVGIHPTQLYESFGNLLIFFILWAMFFKKIFKRRGQLFFFYIALYSILRFIVEFFRGDDRGGTFFYLSQAQMVSCGMFVVSLIMFILFLKDEKNERK